MTRQTLSLHDHTALAYLTNGYSTATWHIARVCGLASTSRARTLLRRLERWGLVEGEGIAYGGKVRWWRITDAGRQAVQP